MGYLHNPMPAQTRLLSCLCTSRSSHQPKASCLLVVPCSAPPLYLELSRRSGNAQSPLWCWCKGKSRVKLLYLGAAPSCCSRMSKEEAAFLD